MTRFTERLLQAWLIIQVGPILLVVIVVIILGLAALVGEIAR